MWRDRSTSHDHVHFAWSASRTGISVDINPGTDSGGTHTHGSITASTASLRARLQPQTRQPGRPASEFSWQPTAFVWCSSAHRLSDAAFSPRDREDSQHRRNDEPSLLTLQTPPFKLLRPEACSKNVSTLGALSIQSRARQHPRLRIFVEPLF